MFPKTKEQMACFLSSRQKKCTKLCSPATLRWACLSPVASKSLRRARSKLNFTQPSRNSLASMRGPQESLVELKSLMSRREAVQWAPLNKTNLSSMEKKQKFVNPYAVFLRSTLPKMMMLVMKVKCTDRRSLCLGMKGEK